MNLLTKGNQNESKLCRFVFERSYLSAESCVSKDGQTDDLDDKLKLIVTRGQFADKLARLVKKLTDVQACLEDIPCDGVGVEGPTKEEISAAEDAGHMVDDNATYHTTQKAWLLLQGIIEELLCDS